MDKRLKSHFVQVVEQYQKVILSLCHVYYTSEEDRQDALQDIILQLWKAFPFFRHECKISTWIYKVALNTILSKKKAEGRQVLTEPFSEAMTGHVPAPAFADDGVQQLRQMLKLLQPTDKAIVILYLEGYSYREIAATLHLTETNISTRFNRIKKRLQKIYSSETHEVRKP